ncbi:hypothetical protein [Rubneribacter sp.]|nr:hypothetical protein [Candidatus Rubneribacter avistercoris]
MTASVLEVLRVPRDWTNDGKQLSLNNVLAELVGSPLELGDAAVEDAFVSFFDSLYSAGFRHRYSEVFGVLSSVGVPLNEATATASDYYLDDNCVIQMNLEALTPVVEARCTDEARRGFEKLRDHTFLEIGRLSYNARINDIQDKRFELTLEDIDLAQERLDESGKKLEKAERRIENAQRENVTILGIFAAIVIAFTAGMGFTASVLQNIDAVSIYRLVFMIVLMGLVLFNLLYALFRFVHRVTRPEDNPSAILPIGTYRGINAVGLLMLVAICVARHFGW